MEHELMEQVFSGIETLKAIISANISEGDVRVIDTNAGKQNYLNIYRRNLERLAKGAKNSHKELKALKMLVDHVKAGEKKVDLKARLEILNSLRGQAKFEYKQSMAPANLEETLAGMSNVVLMLKNCTH